MALINGFIYDASSPKSPLLSGNNKKRFLLFPVILLLFIVVVSVHILRNNLAEGGGQDHDYLNFTEGGLKFVKSWLRNM